MRLMLGRDGISEKSFILDQSASEIHAQIGDQGFDSVYGKVRRRERACPIAPVSWHPLTRAISMEKSLASLFVAVV